MQVHLKQFEGPMALLLYLIRKEEMDIYDIEIHKITHQYLEYVKRLKTIDLEQAGDFIAMAATLIQIKAKMLLPSYGEDGEEEETEDPRKPLVQRLLEYQKYQEAGQNLYDRPLLGRDTFKRGRKESLPEVESELLLEEEGALFSLIKMYRSVIRRAEKATHKVATKLQTIASRILEIKDRLKVGVSVELRDLLNEADDVRRLIITFLSTLELGKLGFVKLRQQEACGALYIDAYREITDKITAQVEEYDSVEAAADSAKPLSSALSEDERKYLQEESEDLPEKPVETLKATLSDREEEMMQSTEAATDEEIEAAEKELNITDEELRDQEV
tara:strand:- start:3754 stop:4746 length:993 start_codon:yes stop_codon:yes gene_type:complete